MKRPSVLTATLLFCATMVSGSAAQLVDAGAQGEMFVDRSTGLQWMDPAQFVGQSRAMIDAFVTSSGTWQWATSAQVDALRGKSAPFGMPLTAVMGPAQFTLSNGGPRWIGYYAGPPSDGWLAQSFNSVGFTTIDAVGFQLNVASWGPGAWLVRSASPLTITQPQGQGSLQIDIGGPANANYFFAVSFDPANGINPGQGWWNGLHINVFDLVAEFGVGGAPFVGALNGAGTAQYTLPAGALGLSAIDVYGVVTFFDATWTMQLGASPVVAIQLL